MSTSRFTAGAPAVEIIRVGPGLWHALDDDRVAGHGEATTRPDGRVSLTVDAWHRPVFDQLARTMLADLPGPLHTVVDGADHELLAAWQAAGLAFGRREWDYVLPTTAVPALPPAGVTLQPSAHEVVAVEGGERVGEIRVVRVRVDRIDLVTVVPTHRRRGIARALVTHALGVLHQAGVERAYARVDEADPAATALFEGFGDRTTSTVELVRDGR
ncbi:GNAT family N-acetyltransferase [Saccharothrix variisporea]|uniref:Acetyltransferase (GNAT) family protein n=1 Tax=Saccharothrix variisporea TaxID=543527 RepID=A0A495XE78_9PSEU|nr:GNAT family N-acetyltransferase [Saccharothrix variisporea]RKT71989.1 acetyltransferase (GNAT) family protein [Saccharothrix variisporea]